MGDTPGRIGDSALIRLPDRVKGKQLGIGHILRRNEFGADGQGCWGCLKPYPINWVFS